MPVIPLSTLFFLHFDQIHIHELIVTKYQSLTSPHTSGVPVTLQRQSWIDAYAFTIQIEVQLLFFDEVDLCS